ncbi:MAG: hypothetical protein RLZZ303_576 [Candidatus Hydrogenedentota bacterium]|jgi:chromosome segregation ATPase
MREILIGVVSACAALTIGAGGAAQYFGSSMREHDNARIEAERKVTQLEAELARMRPDLDAVQQRLARLDADYAACVTDSQALREKMSSLEARAVPEVAPLPEFFPEDASAEIAGSLDAPSEEVPRERRGEEAEEDPEQAERRAQRFEEFRARIDEFFAQEIANAPTEEMRVRLETMDAYRENMFELRAAMRAAGSEEERAQLELEATENREALEQLMREQQRDMLSSVGRNYGLKGEDLRNFQRELREVMDSPYFRFGMGGGPGGPGGWRGGGGRGPR